jgi:hypothetical protein
MNNELYNEFMSKWCKEECQWKFECKGGNKDHYIIWLEADVRWLRENRQKQIDSHIDSLVKFKNFVIRGF